jgi:hypothetical protein
MEVQICATNIKPTNQAQQHKYIILTGELVKRILCLLLASYVK